MTSTKTVHWKSTLTVNVFFKWILYSAHLEYIAITYTKRYSVSRGKLWASKNRSCPRTNVRAFFFFKSNGGCCVYHPSNIFRNTRDLPFCHNSITSKFVNWFPKSPRLSWKHMFGRQEYIIWKEKKLFEFHERQNQDTSGG